jgi:hypothetical protein
MSLVLERIRELSPHYKKHIAIVVTLKQATPAYMTHQEVRATQQE